MYPAGPFVQPAASSVFIIHAEVAIVHVRPLAALLAFVAWQCGDGALANVALDRALADDAGYSMALLLRQVIAAGAPPSLARLPMTPEEVAASYDGADGGEGPDVDDGDLDVDDEA